MGFRFEGSALPELEIDSCSKGQATSCFLRAQCHGGKPKAPQQDRVPYFGLPAPFYHDEVWIVDTRIRSLNT